MAWGLERVPVHETVEHFDKVSSPEVDWAGPLTGDPVWR